MHLPLQPVKISVLYFLNCFSSVILNYPCDIVVLSVSPQVHLTLFDSCEHLPLSFVSASQWGKKA